MRQYKVQCTCEYLAAIYIYIAKKMLYTQFQVEDKDQSRVSQCWSELTAFTKGLLDSSQPMDVPMFARQSDRPYLPSDSMSHYAFIFEQLRKTPSVTGAIK